MKIIKLSAIFVFAFFFNNFVVQNVQASSFKEVMTNYSTTEVYQKPDYEYKVVDYLSSGSLVTVLGEDDSFYKISYRNDKGKIVSGYVMYWELDYPDYTLKIATSKSGLVIKSNPTRNSSTTATLKHGMIVKDFGPVGAGWSFVQYGNIIGYVATSFINEPTSTTKYVKTEGLVVRNIASTKGENLGSLSLNDEVEVYSTVAGWSYVSSWLYEGYVVGSHLTTKNPYAVEEYWPDYGIPSGSYGYANCTELTKDYPHGVSSDHPAYQSKMDRDKDGWACER